MGSSCGLWRTPARCCSRTARTSWCGSSGFVKHKRYEFVPFPVGHIAPFRQLLACSGRHRLISLGSAIVAACMLVLQAHAGTCHLQTHCHTLVFIAACSPVWEVRHRICGLACANSMKKFSLGGGSFLMMLLHQVRHGRQDNHATNHVRCAEVQSFLISFQSVWS
jgi:hypothetical protein